MNLLLFIGVCIMLSGCARGPDMAPIGSGLAVIGLGLVVAALVIKMPGGGNG